MRRLDDTPIDPEIASVLDAIDATLAGDPVGSEHAEVAELALMLRAERPGVSSEFGRSLDRRVARRFEQAAEAKAAPRRSWLLPGAGLASAAVAAAVVAVVLSSGGSSSSAGPQRTVLSAQGAPSTAGASAAGTAGASAATSTQSPSLHAAAVPAPAQASGSRKVVQSAQLALNAPGARIDDVAQEVFQTVGREGGYVGSSTVTATGGPDGYAQFQLTVPSSALASTMTALSALRYASVASRTDTTQDITNQYAATTRALADARALRTSLLKQLANAVTDQQVQSLRAQINDTEASISSDEATLARLNRQVNYTQIGLTINAKAVPVPVSHSGSFTIGRAAHDAGRVLTVAAGVALIALAAAVPLALLGALAWWVTSTVRRRRREQALDAG